MVQPQKAHPDLNQNEYIVASIAGLGLLLAIVAAMFSAFGSREDFLGIELTMLAVIGIALIIIGLVLWLALLRPWMNFDDLKTPYFTGHHDHEDEGDHAEAADTHAEVVVAEAVPAAAEKKDKTQETQAMASSAEAAVAKTAADAEEVVEQLKAVKVDDLELIEGVGPKAKAALVDAGITSFAQVAAMSAEDLERIVKTEGGVRIVGDTATWAKQAQLIADGGVQAFEDYKEDLHAGKEVDDLKLIEGIGPKVEGALHAAGIKTFAQVAAMSADDLVRIVKTEGGVRIVGDAATWSKQAQYVVDGDLEGFEAYKGRLKGGREVD